MKAISSLTQFTDLGLAEPILRALRDEGYSSPTPIQAQAIPHLTAGRDLLGIAQTGGGKTAAFTLPILNRIVRHPGRAPAKSCRALVLAPTRELAAQIADSVKAYGRHIRLSVAVVVGGVKHGPQIRALSRGVDVLVATPGRLIDHMEAGHCRLDAAEVVVLDEADHMLDLGFLRPIQRILRALPVKRQSLFFSATLPDEITGLAGSMLHDPVRVSVAAPATTPERVSQTVVFVEAARKGDVLVEFLARPEFSRTLVFTRTKRGADKVARRLNDAGLDAEAIHGNKSQSQRERALTGFKAGRTRILVATDIAARGIDVEAVSHVVNYELPNVPESYVHRIGRTARAGAAGEAISLCDREERPYLRDIEKLTRLTLPRIDMRLNPANDDAVTPPSKGKPARRGGQGRPGAQGRCDAAGKNDAGAPRPRRQRRRRQPAAA